MRSGSLGKTVRGFVHKSVYTTGKGRLGRVTEVHDHASIPRWSVSSAGTSTKSSPPVRGNHGFVLVSAWASGTLGSERTLGRAARSL
jgi:hypothetical protein